jgi:hypothetical protein
VRIEWQLDEGTGPVPLDAAAVDDDTARRLFVRAALGLSDERVLVQLVGERPPPTAAAAAAAAGCG